MPVRGAYCSLSDVPSDPELASPQQPILVDPAVVPGQSGGSLLWSYLPSYSNSSLCPGLPIGCSTLPCLCTALLFHTALTPSASHHLSWRSCVYFRLSACSYSDSPDGSSPVFTGWYETLSEQPSLPCSAPVVSQSFLTLSWSSWISWQPSPGQCPSPSFHITSWLAYLSPPSVDYSEEIPSWLTLSRQAPHTSCLCFCSGKRSCLQDQIHHVLHQPCSQFPLFAWLLWVYMFSRGGLQHWANRTRPSW